MNNHSFPHLSVLSNEIIEVFQPCRLNVFIDGTLGAGGHAELILSQHPEIQCYIGIDQDTQALEIAARRLAPWREKIRFCHGNFVDFKTFLKEANRDKTDGFLIDIGVSSMQIDQPERGFSFSKEGPLDMRMDQTQALTAADIVNQWSEQELGRVFRDYGEEKKWRLAARAIVEARKQQSILTTTQLAALLKPYFPWNPKKGINPLTLIFQALRICVNRELEVLETFLSEAIANLTPSGRLAVISFHSLEDRIVKNNLRLAASDKWDTSGIGGGLFRDKKPTVSLVTRKPIGPQEQEIADNPRSRSAKLRVAQKLDE